MAGVGELVRELRGDVAGEVEVEEGADSPRWSSSMGTIWVGTSSCPVLLWGCLGDCFDLRARFRLVRTDAGPVCQSSLLVALSLLLAALPLKLLAALPLLLLAALLLLLPAWLAPLPLAWPAALPLALLLA